MAVSRALGRLLRIDEIQEDLSRVSLESAVGELRRLEDVLSAAGDRARGGRQLVVSSAYSGELPDRLAGLEEARAALRRAQLLAPRIADAGIEVAALREAFLARRVERRQAETLIRATEARDAIETARHDQQSLDDWYLNRLSASRSGRKIETIEEVNELPDSSEHPDEQT